MRKKYEMLHMKDEETVNDFFSRTLTIVNKMKAAGKAMEQLSVVEKVLRSMNFGFEYVLWSIEESNDETTMTIEEL